MYFELALISIVIGGAYWGYHFVRHETLRLYGALNLGAAALAGLGFYGARVEGGRFGLAGAIGLGAGTCLLVIGPLARGFARRAAAAEHFGVAKHLLDVADVLAPGSGVGDEKALLAAMREIRDGNIEQTVDALTAAKRRAPPDAQIAIDERIAMLYLAAYRWDEAIAHAEEHLFGALPTVPAVVEPGQTVALRRVLGLAPPVWVELLGAYGYVGNLEQAALMLARLEEVCAGRPDATLWLHRGRMIFLALAGRVGAVQTLIEPKRSRHMKPAARTYWLAVAHERHGEAAAAETAYRKARGSSRGRPRILIDQALIRLATAAPTELGPTATEVVARVEAEPPPSVTEPLRQPGPIATRIVVFAMLAVASVIALALGPSSDVGVLVRDGALVRGLVRDGEWWRLVTCVMVHIGGVHLVANAAGLWVVGRIAEDLLGPWRTSAAFVTSALAGAAASYLAAPAGIAAGASGGMMGILGAVLVELTWQRKRHRTAWTRAMWGSVAVVTVAQLALGVLFPIMDQWAHGTGLLVGAVTALALSAHTRAKTVTLHISRVITLGFVALMVVAWVLVARTSLADSMTRVPLARLATSTVVATVPESWERAGDELYDPDTLITLLAQRVPALGPLDAHLAAFVETEQKRAKARELDKISVAPVRVFPSVAGWQTAELVLTALDSLDTEQRFRVLVAARSDGDAVIVASLYVPERIALALPAYYAALVASIVRR